MSSPVNKNSWNQSFLGFLKKRIIGDNPLFFLNKDSESSVIIHKNVKHNSKYVSIQAMGNSTIDIGENVKLDCCSIKSLNGAKITIGKNVVLTNSTIVANGQNSHIEIGDNTLVGSTTHHQTSIVASDGQVNIGEKSKLMLEKIIATFGGKVSIGKYSGFGFYTDIRCVEKVEIGSFALVSYHVSIYDNNIHSTDAENRRESIKRQFPRGLVDETKPKSSPIIIGDDVWIGKYASVLKGGIVENECVIGLGAIVSNRLVEARSIVVPAKSQALSK
jgi:acetyltransferase-like isoleucine patch superfamily enzyme